MNLFKQQQAYSVWAFDPGHVTGFVQGVFTVDKPLMVDRVAAITEDHMVEFLQDLRFNMYPYKGFPDYIVSEKWLARTNNNFAADDIPKKIEGMMEAILGPNIIWRPRTKKEQVPDRILKEHGLWQTGKSVDWTDGRDVNDAIIHMLGFVAFDQRHLPTLRKYFKSGKD
jgi:hypothetical protein